jgi:23S rRNA pseudouridine2605 synthase
MTEKIRLQRYLSTAGVAARRKAEELIVAGRVRINGKQVRLLGTKVDAERDHVTVDGEAISPRDSFYVVLNKPKGCITAVEDDRGRPTVMEYLPNLPIPVKPVGRLDFYAEGVVFLTNDGDLASRLVSPQRHVPKTYHVKVRGEVRREHLELLRTGVRLADGTTSLPAEVSALPGESRHSWLAITVIERKQHQVLRMMEALGYQVQKLQCVAFANLTFHGLRVGDARELNQAELNALRDLVGMDHSAVARGVWQTYREDTDIPRRARQKQRAEAELELLGAGGEEGGARDAGAPRVDTGAAPRRSAERAEARSAPAPRRGPASRGSRSGSGERSARGQDRRRRGDAEARGPRRAGAARGGRPGADVRSDRPRAEVGSVGARAATSTRGPRRDGDARGAGPAAAARATTGCGAPRTRPATAPAPPRPRSRPTARRGR